MHSTNVNGFKDKYRPFSNFWYAAVTLEGIDPALKIHPQILGLEFPTNEHGYQMAKVDPASPWMPPDMVAWLLAMSPAEIKHWGGPRGSCICRKDWNSIRIPVMRQLVNNKYSAHPALLQLLVSTGRGIIVELNTWGDKFWGAVERLGLPPLGENNLGLLTMERRDVELAEEAR